MMDNRFEAAFSTFLDRHEKIAGINKKILISVDFFLRTQYNRHEGEQEGQEDVSLSI